MRAGGSTLTRSASVSDAFASNDHSLEWYLEAIQELVGVATAEPDLGRSPSVTGAIGDLSALSPQASLLRSRSPGRSPIGRFSSVVDSSGRTLHCDRVSGDFWTVHHDSASGHSYFCNQTASFTTWEPPIGLPGYSSIAALPLPPLGGAAPAAAPRASRATPQMLPPWLGGNDGGAQPRVQPVPEPRASAELAAAPAPAAGGISDAAARPEAARALFVQIAQPRRGAKVSSFMYRYISRESCSQFDSLPLTSLTIFLTRPVLETKERTKMSP